MFQGASVQADIAEALRAFATCGLDSSARYAASLTYNINSREAMIKRDSPAGETVSQEFFLLCYEVGSRGGD